MFLLDIELLKDYYVSDARKMKIKKYICSVKNGHLIKGSSANNDLILYFNKDGQLFNSFFNNKFSNKKNIYIYRNGKVDKVLEITAHDIKLNSLSVFEYDSDGRIKMEICTNYSNDEYYFEEIKMHSYKNNVETIKYTSTSGIEDDYTNILTYGDNQNVISDKAYINNNFHYFLQFVYDKSGLVVDEIELEENGEKKMPTKSNINQFKWETKKDLDTNGNWVRKIRYKNDDPWEITERSIEYY
jgi:hypothetical protein